MASPDGLRLYFGSRLPPDVADLIFQYGFHLWLAKPYTFYKRVRTVYETRTTARHRVDFLTTIMVVDYHSLSPATRKLVNHYDYATRVSGNFKSYNGLARPRVLEEDENPQYLRDGDEWYLVIDCDPRQWNASRFPEPVPQLPDDDSDDEAIIYDHLYRSFNR